MFGVQVLALRRAEDLVPHCAFLGGAPAYHDGLDLQVLAFAQEVVDLSHHLLLLLGAEEVLFL